MSTDLGQLDCLSEIKGLGTYLEVKDKAEEFKVNNKTCFILSLPALIKSKESMNRDKDKESIMQLKAILERKS